MNNSSTLRQALSERLWEQAQARETSFILAHDAGRTIQAEAALIAEEYDFRRDNANTLCTAGGVVTQAAMLLTRKSTGKTLSIVCKLDDAGDELWFILDMQAAPYAAAAYIRAVKSRIEANKTASHRTAVN